MMGHPGGVVLCVVTRWRNAPLAGITRYHRLVVATPQTERRCADLTRPRRSARAALWARVRYTIRRSGYSALQTAEELVQRGTKRDGRP